MQYILLNTHIPIRRKIIELIIKLLISSHSS